jgi:hypothetical protein
MLRGRGPGDRPRGPDPRRLKRRQTTRASMGTVGANAIVSGMRGFRARQG